MALPQNALQGRAHLIREMTRSRGSNASDSASDHGSFHGYETESQQLPALPAMTPQNNHASHLQSEPEFQINTSALRRAFPDFSQYGSSDDGDSFEIGRAASHRRANAPRRVLSSEDPSENISLNIGGEKFTVTGTPPAKPKAMARSVSQKENADPLANHKETDFVSSASSRASQPNRKVLSELNPQEDSLDLTSERPKAAHARTSSTRFAGSHSKLQHDETKTESQPGDTANSAYQSFALPDMSNITELVSGQKQDGTPLFQRSAKKAHSRFNASLSSRRDQNSLPAIGGVPDPEDAKSLHVALQALRDEVNTLKQEKKDAVEKADNYEFEFLQLKAQLDARQHSDSGVDVNNEEDTRTRDFEAERLRLESSIKSLKAKLNRANKKLNDSEVKISQLRGDKLTAEQQLRDAEANSVALRGEGQDVHNEIEDVKRQLARVTKQHEKIIDRFTVQEEELKRKIDRRERAVQEMASIARELWTTRSAMRPLPAATRERSSSRPQPHVRRASTQRFPTSRSTTNLPAQVYQQPHVSEVADATGITTIEVEDPEFTTELNLNPSVRADLELSKNESFMSFMEGDEIAKLRHILDQEKARVGGMASRIKDDTLTGLVAGQSEALPHKSSMKKQPSTNFQDDIAMGVEPSASGIIDDTRTSVASQRSHRRRASTRSGHDMTSALILPDITLQGGAFDAQAASHKSKLIRRPIPVSDRLVASEDNVQDPTLRPAQSPGLALASVVQGLEEEVDRLRARLIQQEQLYNQHDPSLSKRERKIVHARIQDLLAAVELRCDQIYALYDVLEGQKDAGQCMDESEVEVTLQNLGIQVTRQPAQSQRHKPTERRRSNSNVSLQQDKRGRKSVVINIDNDNILSNDDLPVGESEDEFAGFDTTNTGTQRSVKV